LLCLWRQKNAGTFEIRLYVTDVSSYDDAVIALWTPEKMPESYRNVIVANPFVVAADGRC
jgi:hypothetical protein